MQTAITRTSGPGRVLLVDDHPAVRRVLRSLLEEVGGWQVVGEADSGEAAPPLSSCPTWPRYRVAACAGNPPAGRAIQRV